MSKIGYRKCWVVQLVNKESPLSYGTQHIKIKEEMGKVSESGWQKVQFRNMQRTMITDRELKQKEQVYTNQARPVLSRLGQVGWVWWREGLAWPRDALWCASDRSSYKNYRVSFGKRQDWSWDNGVCVCVRVCVCVCVCARLVAQSCLTLCYPLDCNPPVSCPWDSPGKNTGAGCHFLLQRIFPTQGLNPSLLCLENCRQMLSLLSHQGSPAG